MKVKALLVILMIIAVSQGCASKDEFQGLELISTEEISQRKRDEIAMAQSRPQAAPSQPLAVPAPSEVPAQPISQP